MMKFRHKLLNYVFRTVLGHSSLHNFMDTDVCFHINMNYLVIYLYVSSTSTYCIYENSFLSTYVIVI